MVRAYTARRMSGLYWTDIALEAAFDKETLAEHGIEALDPVLAEIDEMGLVPAGRCGDGAKGQSYLAAHWARDKRMIRRSHVLIDLSPEQKSEGVAHEIGYARYELWKPVIRVYRNGQRPTASIAYFENDLIVNSLDDAAYWINEFWGTWPRRFWWRIKLYARCFPKHCWRKLGEWK